MFNKSKKGPKVLYQLTPTEITRLQTVANIVVGLNASIENMLKEITIRERLTDVRVVFDPQQLALVKAPEPQAPKADEPAQG